MTFVPDGTGPPAVCQNARVIALPTRAGKPDSVLAKAVELARSVVLEVAEPADIGDHLGARAEGERVVTHHFACDRAGYPGWYWSVTMTRAKRGKDLTVNEVVLLPGDEAIVAPDWVPYKERLQPGDLSPGDLLLMGADLVKAEAELLLAYDDPLGVTAAFNKNLLVRINRELGGTFDLARFAHRAVWNAEQQRIEMHLVSLADQGVFIAACGSTVTFSRDELIWTESSYKYSADQIVDMGANASFATRDQWIDGEARFALTLFTAV